MGQIRFQLHESFICGKAKSSISESWNQFALLSPLQWKKWNDLRAVLVDKGIGEVLPDMRERTAEISNEHDRTIIYTLTFSECFCESAIVLADHVVSLAISGLQLELFLFRELHDLDLVLCDVAVNQEEEHEKGAQQDDEYPESEVFVVESRQKDQGRHQVAHDQPPAVDVPR